MDTRYRSLLKIVAEDDLRILEGKDRAYAGSWKKRGGVNAFCMLARKIDRIENQMVVRPADPSADTDVNAEPVYKSIFVEAVRTSEEPEGLLEQIGDLRRYLLLVEAEVRVRLMDKEIKEDGGPEKG